jgi:nucleotide-binding universal stress UspA family protein
LDAPYRHIAACVDTSEAAEAVIREALRLRALGPGRLTLLHVAAPPVSGYSRWEPPSDQEFFQEARDWVEARARRVPGAEPVALWGRPSHRAVEWAREAGCDLMIAASHANVLERAGLGGFSRHLAYHAPCPVLLVRPGDAG